MIVFPNAKINIGLNIVEKRADGFHNIETVFYPIKLSDILEINISDTDFEFTNTGLIIEKGVAKNNLCFRAYNLLNQNHSIKPVRIHLHKIIPSGAGLGGGSSDASFTLNAINTLQKVNLDYEELINYAGKLGSDCPFFIKNRQVYATGTGNIFEETELNLSSTYLVIVHPKIHVNTAKAYTSCTPKKPDKSLKELIKTPIETWKNSIHNDFEESVFSLFPEIKRIKQELYNSGAIYASMSGSGSAVFGIFKNDIDLNNQFKNYFIWKEKL